MKKWYKLCPFCANEIKEQAIKCQFCNEWLNKDLKGVNKIQETQEVVVKNEVQKTKQNKKEIEETPIKNEDDATKYEWIYRKSWRYRRLVGVVLTLMPALWILLSWEIDQLLLESPIRTIFILGLLAFFVYKYITSLWEKIELTKEYFILNDENRIDYRDINKVEFDTYSWKLTMDIKWQNFEFKWFRNYKNICYYIEWRKEHIVLTKQQKIKDTKKEEKTEAVNINELMK